MSSVEFFAWSFGAIAVWLFARKHFDTPAYGFQKARKLEDVVFPPHYLTSRLRYWVGRFFYVVLMEILYVAVALLFPLIGGELVPLLPDEVKDLDEVKGLPSDVAILAQTLVSAMLLTAFLPNIGPLAAVESRLRAGLHRIARIPEAARRLSEQLDKAELDLGPAQLKELQKHGLGPNDLSSHTIVGLWARAVCVRGAVEAWGRKSGVGTYMESSDSGWVLIEESFKSLEPVVELYRKGVPDRGQSFDQELRSGLDRLLYRLHRFLSCALLAHEPTENQRNRRMRMLGFRLEPVDVIGWDQITFILGGIALWTFLTTSVMALGLNALGWTRYMGETMIPLEGVRGSLAWSFTALLFHGTAVLAVLLAKRWLRKRGRWPIPEAPLESHRRPWILYAAMGLLGLGVSEVVLISAGLLAPGPLQLWWGLMAVPTAFLLAYHLDTHPQAAHPSLQMVVQGLATSVVAYLCTMGFLDIDGWVPASTGNAVFVGFLVVQAALTGGFIGYWTPARYREYVYRSTDARPVAAMPEATPA